MRFIRIEENGLSVVFRIRDCGIVELERFSPAWGDGESADVKEKQWEDYHPLAEIQLTGKTSRRTPAYKHCFSSASYDLRYDRHEILEEESGKELRIFLETEYRMKAVYHMRFFDGVPVVQTWISLSNEGTEDLGLEYVSSFIYSDLCGDGSKKYYDKTDIYIPRNSWACEVTWQKCDAVDLNLSELGVHGFNINSGDNRNRFAYTGHSSWSSCEFLPMGYATDRETETTYCFQIEHSGQWHVEYGSYSDNTLYLALSGATEIEHGWWKNLAPGTCFESVPAAFGVVKGGLDEASAALTEYRRKIRRPNADDEKLNVIFNDYMNCLMGDPTEEREIAMIDKAADLGCEYYCMDCGWYDEGFWWDRVGEWMECDKRFPNGLKKVYDYAHSKGMKMGMWLEIEVMGTACGLADSLPDNWFVCRHGKRHIDNNRYLLDFRNPEVRRYCRSVVDRLIREYGCEYFKIDYNVTMGYGSDLDSDSCSQAIREHYDCLYQWYDEILRDYPDLVIENCGSGGMRMDYGMLKRLSLQSTSDQTDYIHNAYIGCNVASAVTPEQAGMWVYPYEDDREHVIFNMVNGLLLRPYISGMVWKMSEDNLALMREGIALYKAIREDVRQAVPYFPFGFHRYTDSQLAYGVHTDEKAYLAVLTPRTDRAEIPLSFDRNVKSVQAIYPSAADCTFGYENGVLTVQMPQEACGRLFRFDFE
ncbi:MAG: alpha-galactosidase [Clostridiales bacterium]|nr:alpha-galactosidase [Clostridiales bacterium]